MKQKLLEIVKVTVPTFFDFDEIGNMKEVEGRKTCIFYIYVKLVKIMIFGL